MFKMLNARLPRMQCPDGCGECCGMVSCGPWEGRKIAHFMVQNAVQPLKQGTTCPFFQDNHCVIYPVRPVICRIYGHIDDPRMTCPHGYNVNVRPQLVKRIHAEYHRSLKGGPLVLLHKLVYTDEECQDLWKEAVAAKNLPSSLIMVPATPPEATAKPSPGDNSGGEPDGETDGQN